MTINISWPMRFRLGLCLVGLAMTPPLGVLAILALFTPITTSGVFYLVGCSLFALAAITAPLRSERFRGWLRFSLAWLVVVVAVRIYVGGQGTVVTLTTLPGGGGPRWINRLVHERDMALFGTRVAGLSGVGLSRQEYDGTVPALAAAYDSLEAIGGTTSSPSPSTYLFLQRPAAFDTVVIEPSGNAPPQSAVIYLHGFTGSFTVQAWLVGQAARQVDALTVCPSVWFVGDWWTEQGAATVRRTIEYLHGRGIQRIYLAGLSNGAIGTCRLALQFRGDLAGLILISGGDPQALDVGLPLLALHGKHDERFSTDVVRRCVEHAGNLGAYREFDGDHLLLAKRAAEVQAALVEWLREQEKKVGPVSPAVGIWSHPSAGKTGPT